MIKSSSPVLNQIQRYFLPGMEMNHILWRGIYRILGVVFIVLVIVEAFDMFHNFIIHTGKPKISSKYIVQPINPWVPYYIIHPLPGA